MNIKIIAILIGCVIAIIIIGRLFSFPIKKILKLLLNSILGGVLIYLINITNLIHIGLNLFTALFVGFLGIPGVILLTIFKLIA